MMLPDGFPIPDSDHAYVKVCGLARAGDARLAIELGAAFLGFIFAEESPRRVSIEQARAILEDLRRHFPADAIRPIGVFVDEPLEFILQAVDELALLAVQLHTIRPGEELARIPVPVLQAVRVRGSESDSEIRRAQAHGAVLLDAFAEGKHGGTGKTFDHTLALPHIQSGPVFLAGGLQPGNIAGIVARLRTAGAVPYAFDVSSGLESLPGVKEPEKMKRFFQELNATG